MTENYTTQELTDIVRLAVNETLTTLGMTNGEISYNRAAAVYGVWFKTAVSTGRLAPVRVNKGVRGARIFSISQIQSLKARDNARAALQ